MEKGVRGSPLQAAQGRPQGGQPSAMLAFTNSTSNAALMSAFFSLPYLEIYQGQHIGQGREMLTLFLC